MQNNPNSPYDDVFNNLAKIVEDIVKNMPENQHARIVGYTIITRTLQMVTPGSSVQGNLEMMRRSPMKLWNRMT